jgi:Flp pilus assembly protein TadG
VRGGAAARRRYRSASGQATVETIALAPVIVAVGLAILQLLAVGYASVLAGNAAEAGTLALAAGADARKGAKAALPGWSRARARVEVAGGRVEVHLRPPSPLEALANGLEVSATAAVEAP